MYRLFWQEYQHFKTGCKNFTMQYRSGVFAICKNMKIFVTYMYTYVCKSTYDMSIIYNCYRWRKFISIFGIVDMKVLLKPITVYRWSNHVFCLLVFFIIRGGRGGSVVLNTCFLHAFFLKRLLTEGDLQCIMSRIVSYQLVKH